MALSALNQNGERNSTGQQTHAVVDLGQLNKCCRESRSRRLNVPTRSPLFGSLMQPSTVDQPGRILVSSAPPINTPRRTRLDRPTSDSPSTHSMPGLTLSPSLTLDLSSLVLLSVSSALIDFSLGLLYSCIPITITVFQLFTACLLFTGSRNMVHHNPRALDCFIN